MARARPRPERRLTEIAHLIVSEWYRVLPEDSSGQMLEMDAHSLTAGLNQILDEPCQAVIDEPGFIKIVIPLPPVSTRAELTEYLDDNGDFMVGMGSAVIFGCGR